MWRFVTLACILGVSSVYGQDSFECPDEFEGYFPHDISCDRYWKCQEGRAELKTCGNGLAFADLDPTFSTENCDYLYNVDCGARTELEPAISAPNCPRLYGTFPDEDDCTAFYNCRDGISNRYNCAPGLAFDRRDRVCKWADQVRACKQTAQEEGVFQCPLDSPAGTFTKHGHPEDCRQYYVCIAGTAREYGCPLGTVFKIKDENDGTCSDPIDVPECANYYGDLEFDKNQLVRSGADPEAVGAPAPARNRNVNRVVQKTNTFSSVQLPEVEREQPRREQEDVRSRPAPSRPAPSVPQRPSRPRTQSRPSRPQSRPAPEPVRTPAPEPVRQSPARPSPFRPAPTPLAPRPTPTPSRPAPTPAPTPLNSIPLVQASPSPAIPSAASATAGSNPAGKQPAKVKAGDEYYYYYYYYDDDETPVADEDVAAA